jgi:hypothetical protein
MKPRLLSYGTLFAVSIVALPLIFSQSASAALGGDFASVQADQAKMKGTLRSSQTQAYVVHEIASPNHNVVREYISGEGKVFGVAWTGQFRPDMRQLLGDYFDQVSQSVQAQKASQHGRRPISIKQPGFVVEMGGHMRAFTGRAYVPDMVPQGVRAEEVR